MNHAVNFLEALYRGRVDREHALAITPHVGGKPLKTFFFHDVIDAAEFAMTEAHRSDAWYRVGLVGGVDWKYQSAVFVTDKLRGVADRTVWSPALWAELDLGKAFETIEERDRLLDVIEPRLSLVVESSLPGNAHVYLLIRGGAVTTTHAAHQRIRSLNARFRIAIEQTGKRLFGRSIRLDPVHDLARVLRVPGTLNRKRIPAEPVTLIRNHPYEYTVEDLDQLLPDATVADRCSTSSPGGRRPIDPDELFLIGDGIPHGSHHNTLLRFAAFLARRGIEMRDALRLIRHAHQFHCDDPGSGPTDDAWLERIVMSAYRYRLRDLEGDQNGKTTRV